MVARVDGSMIFDISRDHSRQSAGHNRKDELVCLSACASRVPLRRFPGCAASRVAPV